MADNTHGAMEREAEDKLMQDGRMGERTGGERTGGERTGGERAFYVRVFGVEEGVERGGEVLGRCEVGLKEQRPDQELSLHITQQGGALLNIYDGVGACVFRFAVTTETERCIVGSCSFLVTIGNLSVLLRFRTTPELQDFLYQLKGGVSCRRQISQDSSPLNGQFQGHLSQQQNMLQDYLRTATYQKAILLNEADFRDKVVLEVGSGSGILSLFALQAGARRVYTVQTRPAVKYTQLLMRSNGASDRVCVLGGGVEGGGVEEGGGVGEVSCPEQVDIIVSEPIGYMLLNDRMLESYVHARKWLQPNGLMFPSYSDLHLAPFTDEQLYIEHHARASFWRHKCFYGINLSGLYSAAVEEFFRQPIVDTFDTHILMAKSIKHSISFSETKELDLLRMEIPFVFPLLQSGLVHGFAFWFDVAFVGSKATVWLSTSPSEPLTHWYQVRCLLQTPLFAKLGQTLSGTVLLTANSRQSYDIDISAVVDQSGFRSGNSLDLKNLFFRYA